MIKNIFLKICGISIGLLILIWFLTAYIIEYFVGAAKLKPSQSKKKYVAPSTAGMTKQNVQQKIKSGEIKVKKSNELKKELTELVKKKNK